MSRLVFIILLLLPWSALGATWYAAADGSSTNGTSALPWSPLYAVTNTNPYLAGGDTVLFKAGVFSPTEAMDDDTNHYGHQWIFRKAGDVGNKITYRPESLWGFTVNGGPYILEQASNLVVWGFVITWPGFTNRDVTNYQLYASGITSYAPNTDLLHNLIGNTGHSGIGSWNTTRGKYIAGNVIRFIGFNDWSGNDGGGNAAGSGMYLQNLTNTAEALICGNISYYNYTTGMKAYGAANMEGDFRFAKNISVLQSDIGIFWACEQYQGVTVQSNYVFKAKDNGVKLGYVLDSGSHTNALVTHNYIVSQSVPLELCDGWSNCTVTSNTIVSLQAVGVHLEYAGETTGDKLSHTWDYNDYRMEPYAEGHLNWNTNDTSIDWLAWKAAINGDANSTTNGLPTELVSYVFRPSTDTNFVHVAVFNWPSNTTTTVNLGSYFNANDTLNIYDAQNIPTAYTNFTYTGGNVTLQLDLTNRVAMLGDFSLHRADAWTGFDPRFRAFVIYKSGVAPAQASGQTLNVGTLRMAL